MNIRPVKDEASYQWALAEIEPYFVNEPEPGSPEADRFDVLAALIEVYEARLQPEDNTAAREALKLALTQHSHTQAQSAEHDLADPNSAIDLTAEIQNDRAEILGRQVGEAFTIGSGLPEPMRWVALGRFAYGCAVDEAVRMRGLGVN